VRLRTLLAWLIPALLASGGWLLWAGRCAGAGVAVREAWVWGVRGSRQGDLNFPRAVEAAPDGSLVVVDRSGRVKRFNAEGGLIASWPLPAWANGTPTGIGLVGEWIGIAGAHYSDMLFYTADGSLERQFGAAGEAPGQMVYPADVALDAQGRLRVVDRARCAVLAFDPEGRFLFEIGGFGEAPGQFQRPMAAVADSRGRLWIADSGNHRLQVFEGDSGEPSLVVGRRGSGLGELNYPYDLAVGPHGQIVVAEYGANRIQIFSPEGASLGAIGGPGSAPGEFASPWGVAVDRDGAIWVADTLNHRMQALRIAWP